VCSFKLLLTASFNKGVGNPDTSHHLIQEDELKVPHTFLVHVQTNGLNQCCGPQLRFLEQGKQAGFPPFVFLASGKCIHMRVMEKSTVATFPEKRLGLEAKMEVDDELQFFTLSMHDFRKTFCMPTKWRV
jgi:hypothetical protein